MNLNIYLGIYGHEFVHLALSLLVSFFLYRRYRNWKLIPLCLVFGFLVDVDHLFDYFLYFGTSANINNFFNVNSYVHASGKVYVPLHGWEYIIFFYFAGWIIEKKVKIAGLKWAIVLSYSAHLIFDHFSFPHHVLGYSIIYRIYNNFSHLSFDVPR